MYKLTDIKNPKEENFSVHHVAVSNRCPTASEILQRYIERLRPKDEVDNA